MNVMRLLVLAWILVVLGAPPATAADGALQEGVPDGVLCLTPVEETSYMAVRIPVSPVQALSAVQWFSNDGEVIYPRLLVANGLDQGAPNLALAEVVLGGVSGVSYGWSSATLPAPMGTDSGALYVILQLPANEEHVARGAGGGPGIGYVRESQTAPVYLSPDGLEWVRLNAGYKLLLEPVFVAREPGMGSLSAGGRAPARPCSDGQGPQLTAVYPNPSNPAVHLEFATGKTGPISLSIYDLRGRLVRNLLESVVEPGTYMVDWNGDNETGRPAASGAYFVQLRGVGELSSRRLTLVR